MMMKGGDKEYDDFATIAAGETNERKAESRLG